MGLRRNSRVTAMTRVACRDERAGATVTSSTTPNSPFPDARMLCRRASMRIEPQPRPTTARATPTTASRARPSSRSTAPTAAAASAPTAASGSEIRSKDRSRRTQNSRAAWASGARARLTGHEVAQLLDARRADARDGVGVVHGRERPVLRSVVQDLLRRDRSKAPGSSSSSSTVADERLTADPPMPPEASVGLAVAPPPATASPDSAREPGSRPRAARRG